MSPAIERLAGPPTQRLVRRDGWQFRLAAPDRQKDRKSQFATLVVEHVAPRISDVWSVIMPRLSSPKSDRAASGNGSSCSAIAIIAATGPETPTPLTAADQAELLHLQGRVRGVEAREVRAVRGRALLTRSQYRFIRKHGVISLTYYAKDIGFEYEAASLVYHVSAQLVLNKNVSAAREADKEVLRNEAAQLARAIATMERRHREHNSLSDDDFVSWYESIGHISGLARDYLEVKRKEKSLKLLAAKPDAPVIKTPDEQVDDMFDNLRTLEIDAVAGIASGQEGLFAYRNEGGRLRLIPLAANKATIIGLAGHAPCPLAAMPADLRFYRELLMTGAAFVPDELSDIPIDDVPEGDVANDSYDMLPAYAMYLVESDRFSIAHARRDDGLILEVVPSIDPGYSMKGECFIDNLTRRRLADRLLGEADAAQFGLAPVDGSAAPLTIAGQTKTLTFTGKADGKAINLIIKPRRMGGIWTYRAAPAFSPVASAIMSPETVTAFDDAFMKVLLKKQKDRPVAVTIGRGRISVANDKAAAAPFDAEVQGSAKVQVMLYDLRRAMVGLLGLSRQGGLTWRADPNGLLLIEAATDVATYRAFIQTLEPNRDQPTRSRTLRERVESLPQPEAPAAVAEAA
ncbi:hypothetical protein KRZ98_00030 [Sphingobium sp. AS12]|uniref:hypothetical protein n=1 Tax=Sphingobium sp. AS12 TaxID=2849495 RepID=UPI001C3126E9|nr:hypothetical protein [Sphingobium sp. AS12]MBV2146679.1 hypothetical protein [Sphingobium sp. AS12]